MIPLARILVDIDALAADHPALDHAVGLAARCGASVKIVDVLAWVPQSARHFVTADLEHELVADRCAKLRHIAERVQHVPVTTALLRGRPASALLDEVERGGHHLVVRSHGRDPADGSRPFGAVDMELLRQCPCPVWLIGRERPAAGAWRILAAVHADPSDETEQALNRQILEWALLLRDLGGAQLTLLQAWAPFDHVVLRSRLAPGELAKYLEETRRDEDRALRVLLESMKDRLTNVGVELVQGEPEDVIPRFVQSHGIDVVVMGTVARTGIAGLLIGNTAERVLQRLRGSVLAIKAPGSRI